MSKSKLVAACASAIFLLVPALASAKPYAKSSSSTTTYYSKGKPVGKAVTYGNTTRYYQHGKPVGKSVRR